MALDSFPENRHDRQQPSPLFTSLATGGESGYQVHPFAFTWLYTLQAACVRHGSVSRVADTDAYPDTKRLNGYDHRVPSSREDKLPIRGYAHRYIVRTFVDVPADARG